MIRLFHLAFLALLVLALPQAVRADSWAPPSVQVIEAEGGNFRFTITPAPMESALEYFREEAQAGRDGNSLERPAPIGLLERRRPDGWEPVWAKPLVNEISPVSAIVAPDGQYVVTFDNWHSVGFGRDAIAIYDAAGRLVRALGVTDLVSQDYFETLPRSVSSVSWQKQPARIEGGELKLSIRYPGSRDTPGELPFSIRLADGAVTLPPDALLAEAEDASLAIRRAREKAEADRRAYLRAPLSAPEGCDTAEWHSYLLEAFYRLTPAYLDSPYPAKTVLFPTGHTKSEDSIGWLIENVVDAWEGGDLAIAAPCDAPLLLQALERALAARKTGMDGMTFYIAGPGELRVRVAALVEAVGAELVYLDTAESIPQRAERIPGSVEKAKADEERLRREMSELEAMLDAEMP